MNITELETDRLKFRNWRLSDFEVVKRYFSSEETAKYVGGKKTSEEAWRVLATYIGHLQLKGFSYVAVEVKSSKQFVGCVGLWKSDPWPELELGYWFLPEAQGKGYASEAALKVKQFAFDEMKVATLVSYIDPANQPSIKLAERVGATYDKTIELLDFGPHCVYRYSN